MKINISPVPTNLFLMDQEARKETPSTMQEGKSTQDRLIVCVTGMPGAGKSTVAQVAEELGFQIFRMGDDVRMEAERKKIPPTDENLGAIMLELRQKGGPVAIAILCSKRIQKEAKSRLVMIDGIRNVNEFIEFKKLGRALLVSVSASPARRFEFLKQRGRVDSPSGFASFEARDRRELSVGIGEPIALADETIVNRGSLQELRDGTVRLLEPLIKQVR